MSALTTARIAWLASLAGGVICGLLGMAAEGKALSQPRRICSDPVLVEVKGRFVEVCPALAAQLRWTFAGFVIFCLLTAISGLAAFSLSKINDTRS